MNKKILGILSVISTSVLALTMVFAAKPKLNTFALNRIAPRGGYCQALNYGVNIYDDNFEGIINLSGSVIDGATNVYTKENKGLKFGTSKAGGEITFDLGSNYKSAYVWACGWNGATGTITVNGQEQSLTNNTYVAGNSDGINIYYDRYGFNFDSNSFLTISTSKRAVVGGIAVYTTSLSEKELEPIEIEEDGPISPVDPVPDPIENLVYKLNGTTTGGSSGYAEVSNIIQSGLEWAVTANTTMNPWRFGGKGAQVRTCESKAVVSLDNITKVIINTGSATATVNSITLKVGTSQGASDISEITKTSELTNANLEFARLENTSWAGRYFTIVFDVTCGSSNQYIQLKSVEFYK